MDHFDSLETRSHDEREAAALQALKQQLARAKEATPYYASLLTEVRPEEIASLRDLAALPVTRKSDLIESQKADPPFGGLAAVAMGEVARIFTSPGPIFEFSTPRGNFWRLARAFFAAGFRKGDLVHNAFAYHLTPGGWMLDDGARALGCGVVPAGTGNSEQQVEAIAHLKPSGFCGTPDFLKVLLDKAAELGLDAGSISKALVSGGALFPSMRAEYGARGVLVLQCYATADLGLIAYESAAQEGMILDEEICVEILRPGTGDPLPDGEVGEVVVTSFNPDYPLIRFATGDLSAIMPGQSPCGRTNRRIKGWMGRADQTTKIKGMFVHPRQVAEILKRHSEIERARLVVVRDGANDAMVLKVESALRDEGFIETVEETLQACCKMKGRVEVLEPGSLARDGIVIDDQRDYET
ncbi:MAG: phenylacetate--CoA ligase family protein [Kiloniellales bacterium]|nr:phenylacetate--CoA ligase family protein [Kiloniellales bacterium]